MDLLKHIQGSSVVRWIAEVPAPGTLTAVTDLKPNTNNKQLTSAIILDLRKDLHSGKSHKETIAIWHTRCEQPEHCFGSK